MPTNPTDIAHMGHRYLAIIQNSSASHVHRVQSVDWNNTRRQEQGYELANINPVGSDTDPVAPTVSIDLNMFGIQMEQLTADSSASSVTLGDILSYANNLTVRTLIAKNGVIVPASAADLIAEEYLLGAGVSRISYRFSVTGTLLETWQFFGKDHYIETTASNLSPSLWSSFNTTAPGLIKGRNALLRIGGNTTSDTMYRVQQFTIDVNFQSQEVPELGNRSLAGYAVDAPITTVNFDLLEADVSNDSLLGTTTAGKIRFDQIVRKDIYLMVYNPLDTRPSFGSAESATPVKSFKLQGVSFPSRAKRAQVRGMSTLRFNGELDLGTISGSGGMTVFGGNPS